MRPRRARDGLLAKCLRRGNRIDLLKGGSLGNTQEGSQHTHPLHSRPHLRTTVTGNERTIHYR
jgi:hypothetical protein